MSNSTKRQNVIQIVSFTAIAVFMFCIMYIAGPKKGDVVIIDCSLSEISPDFTTSMREACRQARANNISKDLQKPK